MYYTFINSPNGKLLLAGTQHALSLVAFNGEHYIATHIQQTSGWQRTEAPLKQAARQINEYFNGKRAQFELALDRRGTKFQCQVWAALQAIPYGETRSYADIAKAINHPKAIRAVGTANGSNQLPIVVPCHRVIRTDGTLGGYNYGISIKEQLLDHERSYVKDLVG